MSIGRGDFDGARFTASSQAEAPELLVRLFAENLSSDSLFVQILGAGCMIRPRAYRDADHTDLVWDGLPSTGDCITYPESFHLGPNEVQVVERPFQFGRTSGRYHMTAEIQAGAGRYELSAGVLDWPG